MLYPVSGSHLLIASAPDDIEFHTHAWIEIGEVEALGTIGGEWATEERSLIGQTDQDGIPVTSFLKDTLRRSPLQIVLGNDPNDPGQALLWTAFRSLRAYPFQLVFPGGDPCRNWLGLVTSLAEVFDTANNIMKL